MVRCDGRGKVMEDLYSEREEAEQEKKEGEGK